MRSSWLIKGTKKVDDFIGKFRVKLTSDKHNIGTKTKNPSFASNTVRLPNHRKHKVIEILQAWLGIGEIRDLCLELEEEEIFAFLVYFALLKL